MTIKEYEKQNPEWDIFNEFELEFAEPDNSKEAKQNLEYVLLAYPMDLESIAIVVRSYYNGTINWEEY